MRRTIWVLVGLTLFVAAGTAWAVATPPMSSADDDFHVVSIVCSRVDSRFCEQTASGSVVVPVVITGTPCYMLDPSRGADCFRWKPELVETTRFSGEGSDRSSLYYKFMGLFLGDDLWKSLLVMRISNVVLAGALLAVAFLSARPRRSRALSLSVIAALFPVGIFHVGSSNPTAWAIAGLSVFWIFLLEAWSGGQRSWQVRAGFLVLTAISAFIATIGRGDSTVYILATIAAVTVLRWRWLLRHWVWGIPVIAVAGVGAALSYPRLRSAYSFATTNLTDVQALLFEWWPRFHFFEWPLLLSYVVGGASPRYLPYPVGYTRGLGWDANAASEIELPTIVGILGIAVLAGVVWIGLNHYSWRKILGSSLILTAIFVMSFGWAWGSGFVAWAQARYYIAPMMVLVGLLSLGRSDGPYLRRVQAVLLWAFASLATGAALMAVVRRTANGQSLAPDVAWNTYEAYVQWWWTDIGVNIQMSPNYLIVSGAVASSALIALMLLAVRHEPSGGFDNRKPFGNQPSNTILQ